MANIFWVSSVGLWAEGRRTVWMVHQPTGTHFSKTIWLSDDTARGEVWLINHTLYIFYRTIYLSHLTSLDNYVACIVSRVKKASSECNDNRLSAKLIQNKALFQLHASLDQINSCLISHANQLAHRKICLSALKGSKHHPPLTIKTNPHHADRHDSKAIKVVCAFKRTMSHATCLALSLKCGGWHQLSSVQ